MRFKVAPRIMGERSGELQHLLFTQVKVALSAAGQIPERNHQALPGRSEPPVVSSEPWSKETEMGSGCSPSASGLTEPLGRRGGCLGGGNDDNGQK